MKSFKQWLDERARASQGGHNDSWTAELIKRILPKKWVHKFKRAVHAERYKAALKMYHEMVRAYNRNPDAQQSPGMMIMNPKGLAMAKAAQAFGLSTKEFKKVLDHKTRYEETELEEWGINNPPKPINPDEITEEITKVDLATVERFADKIFAKVGIDVEFTRHFLERVNDKRNGKDITVAELTRLFKQAYKKHGKKIAKMGDDAEAVLHDAQTDINLPFVLNYDPNMDEFDLVAKTVMRKKDFKTNDPKLKV
jgi:hypothetical protein